MQMKLCAPAALLAMTGCAMLTWTPEPQPVPAHFGRASELEPVRRVMVLPFRAAPGVHGDMDMLRDAFIGELAKTKRFELVPLPDGATEDQDVYQSLSHGRISPEALSTLGERYKLDGVLLGTVTGYRPYKPPHLGLRIQLVSLHSATAVWAVEAFYDAADAAAVDDIRQYASSFMAPESSLHGWEMILISPARFAAFVAHRVVGTWRNAPYHRAH